MSASSDVVDATAASTIQTPAVPASLSPSPPSSSSASSHSPSSAQTSETRRDAELQVFYVLRHGDRQSSADPMWKKNAPRETRHDTPLSAIGHQQAVDVAQYLVSEQQNGRHNIKHILVSPFLRTIQTSLPLAKALGLPLKLESSVWETGCRRPPPCHRNEGFPIEPDYESSFIPAVKEKREDFKPRLDMAATHLLRRFPFEEGDAAIVSHADPTAYLVAALCNIDPARTGPVSTCCIFRLERRRNEQYFTLIDNSYIGHISQFGNTEPCHPIHRFHDWCRLFEYMRQSNLVPSTFRWPPLPAEMPVFAACWHERYQRLLRDGPSEDLGTPAKPSDRTVHYFCPAPKCGVSSYISFDLYQSDLQSHRIKCWKCRCRTKLPDIKKICVISPIPAQVQSSDGSP